MKDRIKVPYVTPYDERSGICGHVWAELGKDNYLYITPKQHKRAEGNLTMSGVTPAYVMDDVPEDVRGVCVVTPEQREHMRAWACPKALTTSRINQYGFPKW